MWNVPARTALNVLGFEKTLPVHKYAISGAEYARFNQVLQAIRELMVKRGLESYDLIDVDLFLYFIWEKEPTLIPGPQLQKEYVFDHDEVIEMLVKIGSGLGFEAESEYVISRGARVDAKWTARIANLGIVSYVFEVQKGGSRDSLILNLQRAKSNPTVQKLVVVANPDELGKIKEEVANLPEEFRKAMGFIEAWEVVRAFNLFQEFNILLSKLELVKP